MVAMRGRECNIVLARVADRTMMQYTEGAGQLRRLKSRFGSMIALPGNMKKYDDAGSLWDAYTVAAKEPSYSFEKGGPHREHRGGCCGEGNLSAGLLSEDLAGGPPPAPTADDVASVVEELLAVPGTDSVGVEDIASALTPELSQPPKAAELLAAINMLVHGAAVLGRGRRNAARAQQQQRPFIQTETGRIKRNARYTEGAESTSGR